MNDHSLTAKPRVEVGPRALDNPGAPTTPGEATVVCPECRGAGGLIWREADGSENGERCAICNGFGRVPVAEVRR